ncbi:MAG: FAD-dependent oxidoreductase [Coriobacteriaceae bacterium]|nr:FAD-dependent oxidoreductase [Coriobacteriaceae bacterium]
MTQFDIEYDVVVIGSGGSGKSAAYTIASESDLSVAIFEKQPEFGGTSRFAEGQGAAESIEQKERKVPFDLTGEGLPEGAHFPTREEMIQAYLDTSHYRASSEVVNAFVDNSGETIEILRNLGVEYEYVSCYAVGQDNELYCFHQPKGGGEAVQAILQKACEKANVDMFASTPAKELIVEDGKIVGVKVEDSDGNELNVGAQAVILATGGFAQNPEKLSKYTYMPWLGNTFQPPVPGLQSTGDGLDLALSVGADVSATVPVQSGASTPGKMFGAGTTNAGLQPALWVNSKGKRYVNEEVALALMNMGTVYCQLRDGISWTVFDEDYLVYLETVGSALAMGEFLQVNKPIRNARLEIEENFAEGDPNVAKADTVAELAAQMGVSADALQQTVDAYNAAADSGVDPQFHKPAKYFHAIRKAPLYALKMKPVVVCSCGGITVNRDMQVLGYDEEPVCTGNLFAVGNDASGLYGDAYTIDIPGSTNGFAHTSGRIAARKAIKMIQG